MTNKRAIEIIKNEIKCVQSTHCKHEECKDCKLVMPTEDILAAYQLAIHVLHESNIRELLYDFMNWYEQPYHNCYRDSDYEIVDRFILEKRDANEFK